MFWSIFHQTLPYQEFNTIQALYNFISAGRRPPLPEDQFPAFSQLLTRCWQTNPDDRPTFTDVYYLLIFLHNFLNIFCYFR